MTNETNDDARRLARAKRAIARALCDDAAADVPATLGDVALRPHQREAVGRLRRALHEQGGALLADDAGLGKTYVALALAREARRPLVVLPAALRATWRQAMHATDVRLPMVTHETLSRRDARPYDVGPDLVIVDEAHHARNPATRRWRALADLTRGAHVLLLSATPVHNRRADLVALLSLFMGSRAQGAGDAELARCIVRRERDDASVTGARPPAVLPTQVLALSHDDDIAAELCMLPSPLDRTGYDDPGALMLLCLARQWASSEGALRQALVRQLARAAAFEAALVEGRRPDRAALARWRVADDAVQLGFASMLVPPEPNAEEMLADVRFHAACVRDLVARLDRGVGRDAERAARLAQLRRRHEGARIVAFSSYAGTVRALWRHLRGEPGVAAVTSRGGVVAGGPLSRDEVLRRFAPRAHGCAPPPAAEEVTFLLATDVASEGVNLQDASVVVHLDLPWTPARIEQRVGRVARLGAAHDAVHVYAMAPPASAEEVLALEERLRDKLAEAAEAVGVSGAIVPPIAWSGDVTEPTRESAPRLMERTRERLLAWLAGSDVDATPDTPKPPLAAAVSIEGDAEGGALALVADAEGARLVAIEDGAPTVAPAAVARAVRAVDGGSACPPPATATRAALRRLRAWLRSAEGARAAAVEEIGAAMLRRRAAAVGAQAMARAPRHDRRRAALDAGEVMAAVTAARGAGAELALSRALASGAPVAAAANDAGPGARGGDAPGPGGPSGVLVVIVLVPPVRCAPSS